MKARLSKQRMASIKPGIYVDHRGAHVEVMHRGLDAARERDIVVYRALADGQILVAPLEDFAGIVEAFGERYWRFTALNEPNLFFELAA